MHLVLFSRALAGLALRNVHHLTRTHEWMCQSGEKAFIRRLFASDGKSQDVSKASQDEVATKDQPIPFTKSSAYTEWKAMYIIEYPDHRPKIQRPVVLFSLIALLVYFCILREENDLDELIYQPLGKTVPELELAILESSYKANLLQGLPTDDILKKISQVKAKQELKNIIESKSKN